MPENSPLPAQAYNYDEQAKLMQSQLIQHINQTEGASLPDIASVDLHYIHRLKTRRLEQKQAQIKLHYAPQKVPVSGVTWKMDYDSRYVTRIPFHVLDATVEYWVGGQLKKRVDEKQNCYAYAVWLRGQNADAAYVCPNCGAPTRASELVKGCPYCGTRFLMQELFPKITHYYTQMAPSNLIKNVKPCIALGIVAALAIFTVSDIPLLQKDIAAQGPIMAVAHLFGFGLAAAAGAFLGYILFAFSTIGRVFYEAVLSIPKLMEYYRVKRTLPVFMRQFEPNFSLDYFICKLFAAINMIGYSDDLSDCAVFEGTLADGEKNRIGDLIDIRYGGGLKCNKYWVDNDYAYVDVTVAMDNIYCRNGGIQRKKEKFRLTLCKSIHAETDYGFSIHAVICRNCGGSFDATKEKHCPFCATAYSIRDYDWVVKKFSVK